MTYYPELVPPLDDEEIVHIVDDLADLHDRLDQGWEEWQAERDQHQAEMLGRIATIQSHTGWPRKLNFGPTKIERTRAEIELRIPAEYSAVYREAGEAALRRTVASPDAPRANAK